MASQSDMVEAEIVRFTERAMTALVFEVHANVSEDTPVDLGWARASWLTEINRPHEGTAGSRDAIDRGAAGAALARIVAVYRLNRGPIFITSNVPYMGRLNDGSSTQAPAGFIQKGMGAAVATIASRSISSEFA